MSKIYKIYCIENKIDKKKYIGMTSYKNLSSRIARGYKENTKINKALKLYGKEKFNIYILFTTNDKQKAEEKEKFYINFYNTIENGYNICKGGYINYENLDRSKKVRCVELNKIFNSEIEAKFMLNLKSNHIGDVCLGKRKSCGNYHWEFVEEEI